jgi:hypothetical protein
MVSSGSGAPTDARVRAEVAAFLASPRAAPFLDDREGAGEAARAFLDACYVGLAARPDLLDEEQLREALIELLPPRLDPSSRSAARAIPIARALLDHFFETRPNPNAWKFPEVFDGAAAELPARLKAAGGSALAPDPTPITRPGSKLGRNDPCPCGSGRKWKKCCGRG